MMMNYQHHVEIEEAIDDENENEKKSAGGGVVMVEREHMFDKVVTPSDVGKLNRLVIPKQHAEKYFPLDSSNNEKGLLLNFEDGTGKPWRFRYSYWNSSQSYVMTKGWSRFVKEKKLDAGDIVSFQRGVGVGEFGKDKLFIDWRRRPDHNHHQIGSSYNLPHHAHAHAFLPHHHHNQFYHHSVSHGRAPTPPPPPPTFVLRSHPYPYPNSYPYPQQQQPGLIRRPGCGGVGSGNYGYGSVVNPYPVTGSLIFLRSTTSSSGGMTTTTGMMNTTTHQVDEEEEGEETLQNVYESVPVVQGKAAAKRLRLFGVNMEYTTTPISHQTHDFDILSSALASSSSSINHHHHTSTSTQISMGPPPSTTPTSSTSLPLQLRSFFNGTSSSSSSAKGKSSNTSSSSMSLDLDI